MRKMDRKIVIQFIFLFLIFFLSVSINARSTPIAKDDPVWLEYFYQVGCDYCEEKEILVDEFQSNHPDIRIDKIEVAYGINHTSYLNYTESLGLGRKLPPLVIFHKADCVYGLHEEEITAENLEKWYKKFVAIEGDCPDWDASPEPTITPWIAFLSGFLTGLSPCVVLITAVVSSSLIIQTQGNSNAISKKKDNEDLSFQDNGQKDNSNSSSSLTETPTMKKPSWRDLMPVFSGFLLGVLSMYIILGIILIGFLDQVAESLYNQQIRLVLGILLFILGFWYIMDAFNPNSLLFRTPDSLKKWFKTMANKGTFLYAYALGFVFSFIKIPCVAGILVSLILNLSENPALVIDQLLLFYLGLIVPLLLIMGLLVLGLQTGKLEAVRVKYRPYLRIFSGIIIIVLTIYALYL